MPTAPYPNVIEERLMPLSEAGGCVIGELVAMTLFDSYYTQTGP